MWLRDLAYGDHKDPWSSERAKAVPRTAHNEGQKTREAGDKGGTQTIYGRAVLWTACGEYRGEERIEEGSLCCKMASKSL